MRLIIQHTISCFKSMKRVIVFFVCVVALCPSCRFLPYEQGEHCIYLKNESGYMLSCFVADEFNSGFSYPDTLLPANPNPVCMVDSIMDSGLIFSRMLSWESIFHIHILGCYLFIYSNKKMWIISDGNILVNIMAIWFVMI